jgi:stage 0 sporulation protein B (sporulation initiation phosphotransferase)
MIEKPLTVSDVLRYANHDFLNQLHLIQMNLDLQRVEEAKMIIQEVSDHCKMLSNVNRLQLPKTVEWLQTVNWRYPALQMRLTSDVSAHTDIKFDQAIVQYLENTVIHVYDHLDPFIEQQLQMDIESNAERFQLTFHLTGKWDVPQFNTEVNYLDVHTYEQTNESWNYVLSAKKE